MTGAIEIDAAVDEVKAPPSALTGAVPIDAHWYWDRWTRRTKLSLPG